MQVSLKCCREGMLCCGSSMRSQKPSFSTTLYNLISLQMKYTMVLVILIALFKVLPEYLISVLHSLQMVMFLSTLHYITGI